MRTSVWPRVISCERANNSDSPFIPNFEKPEWRSNSESQRVQPGKRAGSVLIVVSANGNVDVAVGTEALVRIMTGGGPAFEQNGFNPKRTHELEDRFDLRPVDSRIEDVETYACRRSSVSGSLSRTRHQPSAPAPV